MQGHISFAKNAMHKSLATTATQRQKKRGTGGITMAEYIEREKLRKTLKEEMQILKETPGKDDWDKGLMQGIKESIMHLNIVPTADVVEVVRCKDCKWHDSIDGPMRQCDITDDDDFCSYGERKED